MGCLVLFQGSPDSFGAGLVALPDHGCFWVCLGHAQTVLFSGPFPCCLQTILGFSRLFRFGTVGAVWVFSKVVESGFGAPCLGLSWDSPRPFLGQLSQTIFGVVYFLAVC